MTRSQRISLVILLAVQLLVGAVAAVAQPLWLGHEPDYFGVVRFLVENGRLPARSDFDAQRSADLAQATQPPLFTYAAMPLVALLDDGDPVPPGLHPGLVCEGAAPISYPYVLTTEYNMPVGGTPAAGYSLRLLNLLFALGMTAVVYFAARQIAPGHHSLALLAAALVAFQPQIFALEVFISGESLLLLISAANVYFALRLLRVDTLRPVDLAGVILTSILGPLTKTNGYVLPIATVALLVYLILHHMATNRHSRATRLLLIGAGMLVLGLVALSVFNYVRYGSIIGRYENVFSAAIVRLKDFDLVNVVATLRDTYYDYTSVFPIQRQKALWLYTFGGLFGFLPFFAHLIAAAARRNMRLFAMDALLLVYALVALALVLMRANLVNDLTPDKTHTPVRYYVSGLPAMAVMLAIGWHSLVPRAWIQAIGERFQAAARLKPWNWIGWAWALVWIGVVVWNVAPYMREHPSRSVYSAEEFEALAARNGATLVPDDPSIPVDVPRLRAYEASAGDDGILRLTAYLQVAETPNLNYAARVLVEDGNGSSSACELIPHDGLYPVPRWEPGQIVAVDMAIPNCTDGTDALSGPLDVTLGWLPADTAGQFVAQDAQGTQRITVEGSLPRARTCLTNLGVIGEVFQVVQYNGPTTATAGTPFLPSVNWYVRDAVPQGNFARDYVMAHAETGEVFTCRGTPRMGDHPIMRWRRGEIVYFDQCAIGIPATATPGEYNLYIGLADLETGERLPVTPVEAEASGDQLLHVAKVTVQPAAQPVAGAN